MIAMIEHTRPYDSIKPENGSNARVFQVLALSGGGYRGLYTAKIIADIEAADGGTPFAHHFDLIAGTSIGGILALALSLEIPASRMVALFAEHGDEIFCKQRGSLFGYARAPYTADRLKLLLQREDVFGDLRLSACRHPVLVPAINYSTGQATMFKTSHHPNFKRDHATPLVDVALATSAAPGYLPRHLYDNCQYVDGGLFANAPGALALHEATVFFRQELDAIRLLSIGTMSARFTADPTRSPEGGAIDWGGPNPLQMPRRLFSLAISVQETISCQMLRHRLTDERYFHIDDPLTEDSSHAVGLDKTDAAARQVLLGTARERSKICLGDPRFQSFLHRTAPAPIFHHGNI
jgi:predicted acylesterase/phospholipase RssA